MADGSQVLPDRRSPYERWRNMLELAGELPMAERCVLVRRQIKDRLALKVGTVAEAFQIAFKDPDGVDYWRTWCFTGRTDDALAEDLALHSAENFAGFRSLWKLARIALTETRKSGVRTEDPRSDAQLVIERIVANPAWRHLVPPGLQRAFLEPMIRSPGTTLHPERDAPRMALELLREDAGQFPRGHGRVMSLARALKPRFPNTKEDTLRKYISGDVRMWERENPTK